jgi:hypothetical protein
MDGALKSSAREMTLAGTTFLSENKAQTFDPLFLIQP